MVVRISDKTQNYSKVTKLLVKPSSIQDADQILVIDDGKISGLGTHEELLKSNAMYKETFEAQNNGGDFDEQ